jgi:hypothetical protein
MNNVSGLRVRETLRLFQEQPASRAVVALGFEAPTRHQASTRTA